MKELKKTLHGMPGRHSIANRSGLPTISVNEWLTAYHELCAAKEDPVPDGFLTVSEIVKVMGVCRQATSERLNALLRAGKVERVKLRRMTSGGVIKIIPYYKLSAARSSTS